MAFIGHGGQYGHGRHHGGGGVGDDDSVKHARLSRGILDDVRKVFQGKSKLGNDIKDLNKPIQR